MNRSSIFTQLITKVIIPVFIAFALVAYFTLTDFKEHLIESHNKSNMFVAHEIQTILEDQDQMLSLTERTLDTRVKKLSKELVFKYFIKTDSIESADLHRIRQELNMDPYTEDIYIIDRNGVVVNTTFEKDIGLNMFKFGEGLKNFLLDIMEERKFVSEKFSPESKSDKLKKYSYQSTLDGKYIIELGMYSTEANDITRRTKKKLKNILSKETNVLPIENENIKHVDLFIGEENPVSINDTSSRVDPNQLHIYQAVLANKYDVLEHRRVTPGYTDTRDTTIWKDNKKMHYQYTYMPRENSTLFKDSVIRIISDRTNESEVIGGKLIQMLEIFAITALILVILILFVTRSITNPIKRLVAAVNKVAQGDLSERAVPEGSKETHSLAINFNVMLGELEALYNDLEKKVRERTAEISQQKEEIEAQRDQIEIQRDEMMETNRNLQVAYKAIEEQKSNIEDSIHYAKRIQTAILPSSSQLNEVIRKHFVLYKPKDIVSGDFYWAAKKNKRSVVVVADCTGHGVPGAFMSLIGNTLLNKIVNENGITDPAEILNQLRDEIIKSLKQTGNDLESKDGMDVVVCSFDEDMRSVEFAGANNPLYLVRNNELLITKGDKQPVGYFIGGHKPFNNHKIKLEAGDHLYMFTDGYQDQFGGEYDRKFMVRNFKKLIVEINQKSLQEQKEQLVNTMENWMVRTKQIDDMLIMGIRVV